MSDKQRELRQAMVIDDHDPIVEIVVAMLTKSGVEAEPFTSSSKAIDVIRARHVEFDFVLTDLSMPEVGGLDVLREVRALDAGLPVILVSGYGDRQLDLATDAYTWFLQKPWSAADLFTLLDKIRSTKAPSDPA